MTKPVFGFLDKARFKPVEIVHVASLDKILFNKRIIKVPTRLLVCAIVVHKQLEDRVYHAAAHISKSVRRDNTKTFVFIYTPLTTIVQIINRLR